MTTVRTLAVAALAALAVAGASAPAEASHAPPGAPPHTLKVIKRVFPAEYRAEVARTPTSWNRLRETIRGEWRRTHPCAMDTLRHVWRSRGPAAAAEATWECDGVEPWRRDFLRCIPSHEGGIIGAPWPRTLDRMDRWNGGAVGWPPPPGRERNIVLDPWQDRPGWIRGYVYQLANGGPLRYRLPDSWDRALFAIATNPIHAARINAQIAPDQFATAGECL